MHAAGSGRVEKRRSLGARDSMWNQQKESGVWMQGCGCGGAGMTQGFQAPGTERVGVPVTQSKRQKQELVGSCGKTMSLVFETLSLRSWFRAEPQSQVQAGNEVRPSGEVQASAEVVRNAGKDVGGAPNDIALGRDSQWQNRGQGQKPGKRWQKVF